MKLSHFNFELPEELLAEYPSENRDESRLMVLNREKQTIEHKGHSLTPQIVVQNYSTPKKEKDKEVISNDSREEKK